MSRTFLAGGEEQKGDFAARRRQTERRTFSVPISRALSEVSASFLLFAAYGFSLFTSER